MVLYFSDVNATILQVLLEYMYTGQLFVSDLTRTAISEAATYLQIYPVLDLLKEAAKDDFPTNEQHGNPEGKGYTEMSDQGAATGYDSENTIVDESELLATFSTLAEEEQEIAKSSNKKTQKAKSSKKVTKDLQGDKTFTAIKFIKVEKDLDYDDYENDSLIVKRKKRKDTDDLDSDFDPGLEKEKHVNKKSKDKSRRSKSQVSETDSGPKTRSGNKAAKIDTKEKSKPKRKSKHRNENEEPMSVPKVRIKTEKVKVGKENKVKNKKGLQVKQNGPIKLVVKGKTAVKIKQEKREGAQSMSSPKREKKVLKVFKPLNKNYSCAHCKRKFAGHVFLRKHLLVRHKQSFNEDWEFSRYLIKFYSGISKYVENCTVDIRGHKNKYKCTKCKKVYNKYSSYCLHFQRDHMTKNPNFGGKYKFFLISRKLKRLEIFLRRVLEAKSKRHLKQKLKARMKKREPKVKTAECEHCNKKFVNQMTLRAHQKHMHGIQVPSKKYNKRDLKRVSTELKLFPCPLCELERYMISQNVLQKHLKVSAVKSLP